MNNIKKARMAAGLSQKYVAASLCVAAPSVSNWESGKTSPTRENLSALADLFGVTIDYLVGREESNTSAVTFTGTLKPEDIVYNSPLDMAAVNRNLNQSKSAVELQNEEREIAQGVIARLRRLTPERQKQALEYLDFLEQQEGK